jgi:hypothetical protein
MPPFSGFTALVRAFYDRPLYRTVASRRGIGLLYVVFLTALCTVPVLVKTQVELMAFNRWPARVLLHQLPAIDIRNGIVSVDQPTPLTIWEPYRGTALAVIDVTGQTTSIEQTSANLLLTRDHLIYRKSGAETRSFDLARVKHFAIDRVRLKRWIDLGVRVLPPAFYLVVVVGLVVFRVAQVLILAGLGVAIARARRRPMTFDALMRVASLALTPAVVLDAIRGIGGWTVPGWGVLMILALLAALAFGIEAQPVHDPVAPAAPAAADAAIDSPHLTS